MNYATTKKELLTIIFAIDKFCSYLTGSKVIVFTDHAALKYLLSKDKSGAENMVADHLSRLELPEKGYELPIDDYFKGEQLLQVQALASWYADYVNYLVCGVLPPNLTYQ